MTKNKVLMPVALLALLALSACSRESAPVTATSPEAAPTVAAPADQTAETMAPAAPLIWADPLPNCGGKQVTKVYWSRVALAAGPVRIEIGEGAAPGLFASVGAEGSKDTGAWAAPGIIFVLRDASNGAERARVVLTGPSDCP